MQSAWSTPNKVHDFCDIILVKSNWKNHVPQRSYKQVQEHIVVKISEEGNKKIPMVLYNYMEHCQGNNEQVEKNMEQQWHY